MTGSSRRLFWAGQTAGVAIIAIGIRGLLDERLGQPASFARFFLGGVIAHDVILAPLVFVTAWLVKRLVPAWTWPAVRNAMFVSVTVALFSYPFIRGFGRRPTNDTVVPRDYAQGLLVVIGLTWLVTGAWLAFRRMRGQESSAEAEGSDESDSTARISSP
ncbi:MAG TPA: hypothetical protein VMW08_19300 [Acidimicrobiales bacterium]|nr:hypothetical protein [Acidimicrobiales bacterium]